MPRLGEIAGFKVRQRYVETGPAEGAIPQTPCCQRAGGHPLRAKAQREAGGADPVYALLTVGASLFLLRTLMGVIG